MNADGAESDNDEPKGPSAGQVLRSAEIAWQLVTDTIEEVHRCKIELRDGDDGDRKKLEAAIKDLNGVIKLMFQERERIEKVIHGFVAGRRSPAIDLGRARDEIERRMDSLRSAGDPAAIL